MRVRTPAAAAVLTVACSLSMAGTASAADLDCDDFPNQAAAQTVLVADPTDPNRLDANSNGQACEGFTYAGVATSAPGRGQVSSRPVGGVAAGDGSSVGRATEDDGGTLHLVLGGLAFTAAGGAAVAARRAARG